MSAAALHHDFKLVTASSPLQYLKRNRLDRARRLMAQDGYNAGTAARAVGYESASQFSWEFKGALRRDTGRRGRADAGSTRGRLMLPGAWPDGARERPPYYRRSFHFRPANLACRVSDSDPIAHGLVPRE